MKIPNNWTFKSKEVAEGFDAHVREQLPWYSMLTRMVAHIGRHYIPESGIVYDIGASTGNIGNALRDTLEVRSAEFIPLDNSPDMLPLYTGPGDMIIADAVDYEYKKFDFAVCFLVVMFMPPEKRTAWLRGMRQKIKPGGCMVVVDKCVPFPGYLGTCMSRLALSEKYQAGVPSEQIIEKELSLAGVQRPLCFGTMPPDAKEVFRFGDFAAWVLESAE